MAQPIIFGKTIRMLKLYFRNERKVFKSLPREVALVTRQRSKYDGSRWEEAQSIIIYSHYDEEKKEYVLPEIRTDANSNSIEIMLTHLPQRG